MMDKQHILLQAGEKAMAVDAARAAVELARQSLEAAKALLDAAKEGFEAALETCEAAGIPKARARKAIDALNQVWVEAGIVIPEAVESPKEAPSADQQGKEPKRRRKGKAETEGEANVPAAEPSAVESANEHLAASEPDAPSVAPAAAIDYTVEAAEIAALVDERLNAGTEASSERRAAAKSLLQSLLLAKAWLASTLREEGFGIEAFRDVLSAEAAAAVAAAEGLPLTISEPLAKALAAPDATVALSWFRDVITDLEDRGAVDVLSPFEPATVASSAAAAVAATAPEPVEADDETFDGGQEEELPDLPDAGEGACEESDPSELDDDSSFPVSEDVLDEDEANGVVVDDIGEIDFLNEGEIEPAPAPEPASASEPEKPKPPRGSFAPPAFMKQQR